MSEVNKIANYNQMMSWLTRPSVPKTETREDFAIGGGNFYGTDLGTREGFQDIIPGMRYDNLPDSTKNKIIELAKTKPTAEIAKDLQDELPKTNRIADVSKSIKNFLKRRDITPVEQMGGSSIPIEERLAKEKIITNFINKNPEITNADAIAKSINANNPDVFMSPNFVKTSFKRLGLENVLISRHAEIFPQVEKLDKILKKNKALLNSDLKPDAKKNKLLDIYAKETNQSLDEAAANLKSRLAKLGRIYAGEEQRYEKKLYSKIKAPVNYMDSNLHKNIISIADRAGIISNIEMAKLLGLPKKQIDLIAGTANMMNAFDFKVAGDHTDIKALMKNFPNYKKNFTRIEYIKDNLNEYKRGYDRKILSLSKQAKGASPSVQQDLLKKQQVLQNEFANKTGYKLGGFDIKKGRVTINPQTLRLPDLKNPYNDTLQTAMKNFVKTGLPGETGTTFSQIDQRLISSTPEERIKIFEEIQGTTEAKKSQYLKALQKIPKIGKIATAVVGGTAGSVGVSTLANASETVDLNPVKKETTKENSVRENAPAIAGGAAIFGRYAKPLLKNTFRSIGSPVVSGGLAVSEMMSEDPNMAFAGSELLLPEIYKQTGNKIPKGFINNVLGLQGLKTLVDKYPMLRKLKPAANLVAKSPRIMTPTGLTLIAKDIYDEFDKTIGFDQRGPLTEKELLDMREKETYMGSIADAFDKSYKENLPLPGQEGIESLKEKYAIGGRVGFADGPEDPNKRKFMKIMGGLASIPILGRFIDIGTQAPKIAEVVKRTAEGVPAFLTDLIAKVKLKAAEKGTKYFTGNRADEFADVYQADNYVVTEQGNKTIIREVDQDGDMLYKENQIEIEVDPETGGVTYNEASARPDAEGKLKDVEEYIEDDDLENMRKYTYDE